MTNRPSLLVLEIIKNGENIFLNISLNLNNNVLPLVIATNIYSIIFVFAVWYLHAVCVCSVSSISGIHTVL